MPTIRIDNEVWEALQELATPFEDSPNSVLRRVLGLGDPPQARHRSGMDKTPQRAYRQPILDALMAVGGRGHANEVLDRVWKIMKSVLKPADLDTLKSGDFRWRNTAMWERSAMVRDGLLKSGSPRGYWEISGPGREKAAG